MSLTEMSTTEFAPAALSDARDGARVLGFSAEIETDTPAAELRQTLHDLAANSAFCLVDLDDVAPGAGGKRIVSARFELCAKRGVVGDAQIYAFLMQLGPLMRWQGVAKTLA